MKILSWNVNGLRASIRKGFYDFLRKERPDVLCLQEIKMDETPKLPEGLDYHLVWNPAERKGYAGTAVFCREKPDRVEKGMGVRRFDKEGRTVTLRVGGLILVNAYFPHSRRDLERLEFKLDFNEAFAAYVGKAEPDVICGDFNVAHREMDIARPKDNVKNAGFTPDERAWMTKFLDSGYVDTFRHLHPKQVRYTWWSWRFNARARNIGWRIDYVIVPDKTMARVGKAFVMDEVQGSDHAPVGVVL